MYIITWTGMGWLFLVIPGVILIVCGLISDVIGTGYLPHLFGVGLILSAVICWFFGKKVNEEKIITYDEENGDPIIQKNMHTLWSIPVQYFSFIFAGIAVICVLIIIFI